jgi:hypothetical protein
MILSFKLPLIVPQMVDAAVHVVLAEAGQQLRVGSPLLELTVDLSSIVAHDCPPVSHYRVVLREAAWLRRLLVTPGSIAAVGDMLAEFSTTADEPLDADATRPIRVNLAGVIPQWQNRLW